MGKELAPDDPWRPLRRFTDARIGLPRSGFGIATSEHLAFQLDHARARDAVYDALDLPTLEAALADQGLAPVTVSSAAADRRAYLGRPDLGRKLTPEATATLEAKRGDYDLVFVIADGLSARAVNSHAAAFLATVRPLLPESWRVGPAVIVRQGRVAVGDAIGAALGARMIALLIGERPGLSSPDSLGVYLTWDPVIGRTDAERNCLSNIRPEGLVYAEGARRLAYLLTEARARKLSGVALKDDQIPMLPAGP
jgi:ethanolamine ammonia-lyase small subunit